ncbi:Alanine dehydrogenase [Chitinophaga costaii]|uniref:Alanine dehydrogenase n=1 Tax=Chitinophaga costaii TaxID=1335309 RepID=A0A1C4CTM9_9BACT|nr:NAD(P)-dependent oxidoreductase [Chitinophaga costaii]PUZ27287.1 alanine dehydrogenase [Chitinophaga costaii]SCC22418.1 Alanine dehydrogenase [Chitinophaga costaii]
MEKQFRIGLIREAKIPQDNRVAFTPLQCHWIQQHYPHVKMIAQPSPHRCYTDAEYTAAGIEVADDMEHCDILLGIKEVPPELLIAGKTYLFFSHTKKKQPYNQQLLQTIASKNITLVDYECLTHSDGQRMLGFGFFAGVVGAHNGLMTYGQRTGTFHLKRVHACHDFQELISHYFGVKLPPMKIAITGSGRVTAGTLEIMGLLGIKYVTPDALLMQDFEYPVYTQLKAGELYLHRKDKTYNRLDFHHHPENYECRFRPFVRAADLLINGIYWDERMEPLFSWEDLKSPHFRIQVIADITDDASGSIPCNLGDGTIDAPVYGVNRQQRSKTAPHLAGSVDMMCVGNLPNELPRDASHYFGDQLMKYVFDELLLPKSELLQRATIIKKGSLTPVFSYLQDYLSNRQ